MKPFSSSYFTKKNRVVAVMSKIFVQTRSALLIFYTGISCSLFFTLLPNSFSQSIDGGYYHSIILCGDSTVWATGGNDFGQLGNGTTAGSIKPVIVNGLTQVISVAAGGDFSLSLKSDGTIWSWGLNTNGQLGNNSVINSNIPVQVQGLSNIYSISAGENYGLALKNDGSVWSWGKNNTGQLGDGTITDKLLPVKISNFSGVIAISASKTHSLALKNDGTVWAWGSNTFGQLGNATSSLSLIPVQISEIADIKLIATGMYHSLAVKNDGTLWAWGFNEHGVFGNGTTVSSNIPVQVSNLAGIREVFAGQSFSMIIGTDSTVKSWGNNQYGQIGNGNTITQNAPVSTNNISEIVSAGSGIYHSLAIKADGTAWGWGYNNNGQLGDSTTTDKTNPVLMKTGCPVSKFDPVCGVTATFTASQMEICSGESISFTNNSLGSSVYEWMENGILFSNETNPLRLFSSPGNFSILLIANPGICADSTQINIIVNPKPDATITPTAELCSSDSPLQISSATSGGTWSGTGISSSGLFDPSLAGIGTHTITYSVTVGNCSNSDSEDILVNANPDATISPISALCTLDSPLPISSVTSGGTWSGNGISSSGIFDPSLAGSGTHTITYSVTVGNCSNTDSEDILVNANPDATVTPIAVLCSSDSSLQISSATSGGTWSGTGISSSGLFDPSLAGSGTHTVTYSVTVGNCSNSDSEEIIVNPLPQAAFVFTQNGNIVSFTNNSTNATSYMWDFGDGMTSFLENPQHTYLTEGIFDVILVVQNSCGSSSISFQITVTGTGMKNIGNFDDNVLIFPNPNPGIFTLVLSELITKSDFEVKIYNVIGEELLHFSNNDFNQQQRIDLTDNGSGIYFLKVNTKNNTITRRVVAF